MSLPCPLPDGLFSRLFRYRLDSGAVSPGGATSAATHWPAVYLNHDGAHGRPAAEPFDA
jgi:hypothetical protein